MSHARATPFSSLVERLGPVVPWAPPAPGPGVASPTLPLIGVPVLAMPEHIRRAVAESMDQHDPRDPRGLPELRQAIADSLLADQGLAADPARELLVTHGAMHGLSVALRALVGVGDEVVVPAPTFFFEGAIRLAGATPVYVPGSEAEGWRWDVPALERAVTPRTRVVLLCNPNNPTGYLPTQAELRAVVEVAVRHGLVVVADESYQRYVFDGLRHTPLASMRGVHPQLVTVTSLSKNYAFARWRMGYILAPEEILSGIRRVFEWDAIWCGLANQRAAIAAITGPQGWLWDAIDTYQAKRDLVFGFVERSGELRAVRPQAGAFMLLDCSAIASDGGEIERRLLGQGIRAVPGRYFNGPDSHVRIPFGSPEPVLRQLMETLAALAVRHAAQVP